MLRRSEPFEAASGTRAPRRGGLNGELPPVVETGVHNSMAPPAATTKSVRYLSGTRMLPGAPPMPHRRPPLRERLVPAVCAAALSLAPSVASAEEGIRKGPWLMSPRVGGVSPGLHRARAAR